MEPASLLIDEASDLAAEGKTSESVEKYRKALVELERIEAENAERAKKPEFATLRNKRAYVNAAIDSLLLIQVKENARAVAVSDTTELEKKLAEERALKEGKKSEPEAKKKDEAKPEADGGEKAEEKEKDEEKPEEKPVAEGDDEESKPDDEQVSEGKADEPSESENILLVKPTKSVKSPESVKTSSNREQAMRSIASGEFAEAEKIIDEMLAAKPNGAMALNLKATLEARQGKLEDAERTLDRAIMTNPRHYAAYYNMAILVLQKDPENVSSAKRYYETGRTYGGPVNPQMEALFK